VFPQPHVLLLVGQEVCHPLAGGVGHMKLRELVVQQRRDDGVEGRAEVYKQDPGVGSWGVQMLEDEVKDMLIASSTDLLAL